MPHVCPFARRLSAPRIPAPNIEEETPDPTTYVLSKVELALFVNIIRPDPAPREGAGENLETRLPVVCTFVGMIYYIILYIFYSRKLGLIQISFVGKISPDMHLSPSPTLIQLRNPRSSPI